MQLAKFVMQLLDSANDRVIAEWTLYYAVELAIVSARDFVLRYCHGIERYYCYRFSQYERRTGFKVCKKEDVIRHPPMACQKTKFMVDQKTKFFVIDKVAIGQILQNTRKTEAHLFVKHGCCRNRTVTVAADMYAWR
tara:strand:- start:204 stop:614 length:411 start_codon:yes stop_codon:yes gene_type:complete